MPVYEYKCESCGHKFEDFRNVSDAGEIILCLKCGKLTAKKQVSAFSTSGCCGSDAGVSSPAASGRRFR